MQHWPPLLTWLENSALGQAVRGAGVWSYGVINLIHILGIATLFGAILMLDLHLLGVRRQVALTDTAALTLPIAITGFCVAAISGLALLATNATEYQGNPFLLIKFAAIAAALLNAFLLHGIRIKKSLATRSTARLRIAGGLSLLCWLMAISAGRLVGYW